MRHLPFCMGHVSFCREVVGLWRFGVVKAGGCDLLELGLLDAKIMTKRPLPYLLNDRALYRGLAS